jgi:hypothetical protein
MDETPASIESVASGLRLSGVVAMQGEPKLAVIEAAGLGSRVVRPGDRLRGGVRVARIGDDWIELVWNGETHRLSVQSAAPRGASAAAAAQGGGHGKGGSQPPGEESFEGPVVIDDELGAIIDDVAANEGASAEDLAFVVGAYLGLPPQAEISITDLSFADFDDALGVKQELNETGMVRMRMSDMEGDRMLYLKTEGGESSPGAADDAH